MQSDDDKYRTNCFICLNVCMSKLKGYAALEGFKLKWVSTGLYMYYNTRWLIYTLAVDDGGMFQWLNNSMYTDAVYEL